VDGQTAVDQFGGEDPAEVVWCEAGRAEAAMLLGELVAAPFDHVQDGAAGNDTVGGPDAALEQERQLRAPDLVVRVESARQQTAQHDAGPIWQGGGLIFTTQFGTPVEPRNFNRSWDSRIAKAKIRKITVHDGRRTCATLLVDLDIHPRQVMRILRHAQFAVTMEIYAQASSAKTRDALKRLGDSLDD
jgi:integrase